MNSRTRILTAIVVLPVLVLAVLKLKPVYFAVLLAVVAAAAMAEFCMMYKANRTLMWAGMALAAGLVWGMHKGRFGDAMVISAMAVLALRLFMMGGPRGALNDVAPVLAGLLYVGGLMSFQITLRSAGPEYIIFLYAAVWASDASAYYVGCSIGRHKLHEPISPNKTVEGGLASIAGGTVAALLLKYLYIKNLSLEAALVTGLIIGTVAVVGDLVESMFKRDAGVKDSGAFFPGHGGLLDKIDGALYCGPVMVWVLSQYGVMRGFRLPF